MACVHRLVLAAIVARLVEQASLLSSDIFNKISDGIQEVVQKWSSQRGNEKDLEIMLKGCIAGVISAEMHRKPIIFVTVMLNGK